MDSAQTLLLNQGFEPIKVISWQRAISLLFLGKVEVLEEYSRDVHSVNLISATSFGFTQVVSAFALMRWLNGGEGVRNGTNFLCSSSSMAWENPVPT